MNGISMIQDVSSQSTQVSEPFIDLKKVSLIYGEKEQTLAIDRLSLSIDRGSFVAVVGPSGCGKSTLLKLISGLIPPSQGDVLIEGAKVTGPVQKVGMAFQNPLLMPWRTTLRNVVLPMEIVERNPIRFKKHQADHVAKARQLLASVGLKDFEKKFPWQLSGGMQQRASLCRSIIHNPEILMLDEPFGALDSFTREELWQSMQDLWLKEKFTALLITHDLREAVFLADVIYVMSGRPGKIVSRREVKFPRRRSIELMSDPAFIEIVQELRQFIAEARSQQAG
jgi:NitT/TauT family transport system ATP-binding protein